MSIFYVKSNWKDVWLSFHLKPNEKKIEEQKSEAPIFPAEKKVCQYIS